MICPNCGSNISDKRKRCERCGTDLTLYKKIFSASNLYYNNGLARAKVRDLSGSIIALRNSLELNKMNTNARNLLGLVYYEMGETVAALSEWVISRHLQPENNDADDYINRVQSNLTKLDSLNQAIKRYNNAINYAKQGSCDLAIIQLKKVITLNPHFIRAYHLLVLCYMKGGDNERARKYLLRVAKIDVSNTATLQYLREIEAPQAAGKDNESNPETEQNPATSSIVPVSSYKEDKPNIMAYINLVIGVIIGIALMFFLVIPTIEKNKTTNENKDYVNYGSGLAVQEEKQETIDALKADKDKLQKQVQELQTKVDGMSVSEDDKQLYDTLFGASQTYLTELAKPTPDRNFTELADTLASIDEKKYNSQDAKNLLSQIRQAVYPEVAGAHYEKGHTLYNQGKYEDALKELDKALTFDPADVDAIYFTARAYQRLDDVDNATLYYNKVINDYPDSDRVPNAKGFLKQLQ